MRALAAWQSARRFITSRFTASPITPSDLSRPNLPGADRYYAQALSLPLFASMTVSDAETVVHALIECLGL
jgi:dTDP-4-amino-4,6-dideoxygalactose transaminase